MQSSGPVGSPYLLARYGGARPVSPAWFDAALAHAPERSRFASRGASIELLTWGEPGRPALLFLHGSGAHADWWSHIAPFFAGEWRCAAISWSGMGRSERRADGYTLDVLAQEASDALEAAGLLAADTKPIVIGHSLGGMVGLATAARDARVGRLVIVDTPVNIEEHQWGDMVARAPKPRTDPHLFGSLEEGLARFRLSPPQAAGNDFIADHIARCSLVEHAGKWTWCFDPRRIVVNPADNAAQARNLRCPTAFIYGERSTVMPPATLARTMASLPAGTPCIGIPDAAHHMLIDQPLALVSTLRALLACWAK